MEQFKKFLKLNINLHTEFSSWTKNNAVSAFISWN
jgi:hypothetical protein